MGRSNSVNTDALINALEKKIIAGAHLDVFDEEPLSKESKLWEVQNLMITPHVSGSFANDHTRKLFEEIALDNIQRFINGEPLRNQVDFSLGYRKNIK